MKIFLSISITISLAVSSLYGVKLFVPYDEVTQMIESDYRKLGRPKYEIQDAISSQSKRNEYLKKLNEKYGIYVTNPIIMKKMIEEARGYSSSADDLGDQLNRAVLFRSEPTGRQTGIKRGLSEGELDYWKEYKKKPGDIIEIYEKNYDGNRNLALQYGDAKEASDYGYVKYDIHGTTIKYIGPVVASLGESDLDNIESRQFFFDVNMKDEYNNIQGVLFVDPENLLRIDGLNEVRKQIQELINKNFDQPFIELKPSLLQRLLILFLSNYSK